MFAAGAVRRILATGITGAAALWIFWPIPASLMDEMTWKTN